MTLTARLEFCFKWLRATCSWGLPCEKAQVQPDPEDRMSRGNEGETPEEGKGQERKRRNLGTPFPEGRGAEVRLCEGSAPMVGMQKRGSF